MIEMSVAYCKVLELVFPVKMGGREKACVCVCVRVWGGGGSREMTGKGGSRGGD